MEKVKKDVFAQIQEALANIAEKLDDANDALYVVASEMMDTATQLEELNLRMEKLLTQPIKVTFDIEELAKAIIKASEPSKKPEIPKFRFTEK